MKSPVDVSVVCVLSDVALLLTDVGLPLTDVSLPLTDVPLHPSDFRKRLIDAVVSGDSWVNMLRWRCILITGTLAFCREVVRVV